MIHFSKEAKIQMCSCISKRSVRLFNGKKTTHSAHMQKGTIVLLFVCSFLLHIVYHPHFSITISASWSVWVFFLFQLFLPVLLLFPALKPFTRRRQNAIVFYKYYADAFHTFPKRAFFWPLNYNNKNDSSNVYQVGANANAAQHFYFYLAIG